MITISHRYERKIEKHVILLTQKTRSTGLNPCRIVLRNDDKASCNEKVSTERREQSNYRGIYRWHPLEFGWKRAFSFSRVPTIKKCVMMCFFFAGKKHSVGEGYNQDGYIGTNELYLPVLHTIHVISGTHTPRLCVRACV